MSLDGRNRFQLNILVNKPATLSRLVSFKDDTILPIIWVEAVSILSIADLILLQFLKVYSVSLT